MGEKTTGILYAVNEDGSYTKMGKVSDAEIDISSAPDSDKTFLRLNENESFSCTLVLRRMTQAIKEFFEFVTAPISKIKQ